MRNRVASLERKRKRFPANNQLDSDDSLVRSVSWGKSFIKELVFALSSYVPPTGLLVFLRCLLILQSSYSQIRFREAGTRCVAGQQTHSSNKSGLCARRLFYYFFVQFPNPNLLVSVQCLNDCTRILTYHC